MNAKLFTGLVCLGLVLVGCIVMYTRIYMYPSLYIRNRAGLPQPRAQSVSYRSAMEGTRRNGSTLSPTFKAQIREHTSYNYFVQHDDADAAVLFDRVNTLSISDSDRASIATARGLGLDRRGQLVWPPDLSVRDKWAILVDEMRELGYQQRLPDAVIIGVVKSGTSAMVSYLARHPQLSRSILGEANFFNYHYSKGLEYYRSCMEFSRPNQRTFEKSPLYVVLENGPKMLKDGLPESAQLLLCVRDPVERLISSYRMSAEEKIYKLRTGEGNFSEAWFETEASQGQQLEKIIFDSHGEVKPNHFRVDQSTYAKYFKRWLPYFPRDRFYVVSHERVDKDLYTELKNVEEFLGLEPYFQRDMFYYDEERHVPCMFAKCPENTTPGILPKARLRPDAVKKLRDYFRPHNREFEQLTQMTFSWTNL